MGMILSLLGSWQAKLAAVALTALASAAAATYITHGLDDRTYKALQLQYAQKLVAAQQADAAAQARFTMQQTAASAAAGRAIQAARDAQVQAENSLSAALLEAQNEARKNHEQNQSTSGTCLGVKLSDSVRQQLAR